MHNVFVSFYALDGLDCYEQAANEVIFLLALCQIWLRWGVTFLPIRFFGFFAVRLLSYRFLSSFFFFFKFLSGSKMGLLCVAVSFVAVYHLHLKWQIWKSWAWVVTLLLMTPRKIYGNLNAVFYTQKLYSTSAIAEHSPNYRSHNYKQVAQSAHNLPKIGFRLGFGCCFLWQLIKSSACYW